MEIMILFFSDFAENGPNHGQRAWSEAGTQRGSINGGYILVQMVLGSDLGGEVGPLRWWLENFG